MDFKRNLVPTLALFGSFGTLLCCALPALFVALGAGATLVGIVSAVPQLIWLSAHKRILFGFAGVMLTISAIVRAMSHRAPCPADPSKAKLCIRLRRIGLGVFVVSLGCYAVGFYFEFIAQHMTM